MDANEWLRAEVDRLGHSFSEISQCLRSVICYEHRGQRDTEKNWNEPGICLDCKIADLKKQIEVLTDYDTETLIFMKDNEIADLKHQLAEARHWLESREAELKSAQDTLTKAYEHLSLAREENLSLRQREAKA